MAEYDEHVDASVVHCTPGYAELEPSTNDPGMHDTSGNKLDSQASHERLRDSRTGWWLIVPAVPEASQLLRERNADVNASGCFSDTAEVFIDWSSIQACVDYAGISESDRERLWPCSTESMSRLDLGDDYTVVRTPHNPREVYRIKKVREGLSPADVIQTNKGEISFKDYYASKLARFPLAMNYYI